MSADNEKHNSASADSAYGGSKYRLSYDRAVRGKTKKSFSSRTVSIIAAVAIIALFAAFAILIIEYYDGVVKKIYDDEEGTSVNEAEADFQSNIGVVVD